MEKLNTDSRNNISDLLSGFKELDEYLYNFDKNNLYILAGRPGMGKTALGLNIVNQLAIKQKKKVVVVSYEMSDYQIASRLLSISSEVENEKILKNNLTDTEKEKVEREKQLLNQSDIYIDTPSFLTFNHLKSKLLELQSKVNIDFLLIDDIHRISISEVDRKYASNREQEVSKNVKDLKALAKKMQIPILAISQLNRDNKDRVYLTPILTDIRDSGSIENDSDIILFLHRPEYYGITEDEEGNSLINVAEIVIAKNRHGRTGNIKLSFKKGFSKFFDLEIYEPQFYSSGISSKMDEELDIDTIESPF